MTPPPRPPNLLRTLPGRLFLLSGGLFLLLWIGRQFFDPPEILQIFRRVVAFAFLVASVWLAVLLVAAFRYRLLWRVRVKLLLSYIFLGFIPVVLVVLFSLAGGVVLYNNVAAYLFHQGFRDVTDDVAMAAEVAAADVGRTPAAAATVLDRTYENLVSRYPGLSLALVRAEAAPPADGPVVSGPWRHASPPARVPDWVVLSRRYTGVLALEVPDSNGEAYLLVRAVSRTADGRAAIVADLPIDTGVVGYLDDLTGTRIRRVQPVRSDGSAVPLGAGVADNDGGLFTLFRRTVAFMDYVGDWESGRAERVAISLQAPIGRLYDRLVSVQPSQLAEALRGGWLLFLVILGLLFLLVQGAALVMGAMLARSITYAVHALFAGTERIGQGDFAHRIRVESRDQLGDLAASFNRMSASIEHLLHVQREKQRLDDELRIAREIQRSLLPETPPAIEGLDIADLCEPAREVGGDYYDFFRLGPRRVGVLIADVAGKGTSAALYMAELKGLMLALSHDEPSPRELLIEVNRRLAGQLDNRSFITMTYAVVDLDQGTLRVSRAGHAPLLVVSGGACEVVAPEGMVLGLRLPGAEARFEQVLAEETRPFRPGDVALFYTDGVSEAMDAGGELFGEEALARVLVSHHRLDAAGIRERIMREIKAFAGEAEAHDDMTMVVVRREAGDREADS